MAVIIRAIVRVWRHHQPFMRGGSAGMGQLEVRADLPLSCCRCLIHTMKFQRPTKVLAKRV